MTSSSSSRIIVRVWTAKWLAKLSTPENLSRVLSSRHRLRSQGQRADSDVYNQSMNCRRLPMIARTKLRLVDDDCKCDIHEIAAASKNYESAPKIIINDTITFFPFSPVFSEHSCVTLLHLFLNIGGKGRKPLIMLVKSVQWTYAWWTIIQNKTIR